MLEKEVRQQFRGKVLTDKKTRHTYSQDTSLFEIEPEAIFFPKSSKDIKKLVRYVNKHKKQQPDLSITARSAGTDMTGGPLNTSFILNFTKHMNKLKQFKNKEITVEPGMYYRHFEKTTLKKNLLMPTYPASRELCAIGGMVANNAGGEKSLRYGKTIDYVTKLKIILADGNEYLVKPLNKKELKKKCAQKNFEGKLYKKIYTLVNKNYNTIKKAKPDVSKNSSGYNLWDVWDKETFDLTKLFVGSQGTLGIVTEASFKLEKKKKHTGMIVIFCKNFDPVIDIVHTVLPFNPSSFESFDDHTLRLALKFFPDFLKKMGTSNIFSLGLQFIPEFWHVLLNGIPRLTLLVEFEEDTEELVHEKISLLHEKLKEHKIKNKCISDPKTIHKYWLIRRESFILLRNRVKDKQTAPFIDDFIIKPEKLRSVLPKIIKVLEKHKLLYTIIGHIGNGNFHIIPLMDLSDEKERKKIPKVSEEVYTLVLKAKGSITAEHNDGLIRSPYLKKMYGPRVYKLFEETKKIFDPKNIFNPGKKVHCDFKEALKHIKTR